MPERQLVHEPRGGPEGHREAARALQRGTVVPEPRLHDACGVRRGQPPLRVSESGHARSAAVERMKRRFAALPNFIDDRRCAPVDDARSSVPLRSAGTIAHPSPESSRASDQECRQGGRDNEFASLTSLSCVPRTASLARSPMCRRSLRERTIKGVDMTEDATVSLSPGRSASVSNGFIRSLRRGLGPIRPFPEVLGFISWQQMRGRARTRRCRRVSPRYRAPHSAALRPGPRAPEALQGGPQWPEIFRLQDIPLCFPGRCRPSGGSACRKISALTKQGIDPR